MCFAILFLLCKAFFGGDDSKYKNLLDAERTYFGGIVANKTNHHLKITDVAKIIDLPAGKTSRDIGLFDADSIIIDTPTIFNGKKYTYGVVKICDISSVEISSSKKVDKIKLSLPSGLCPIFDRVGWFSSLDKAFPPIDQ